MAHRILCTEDNRETRELIALVLTDAGFEVVCTEGPEEALELAKTKQFDLYVIDNWLPGISGDVLCRKLRVFDTKTPILFYSGAAFEINKVRAREAGAQGYLVKPVEQADLVAEVVRLIDEARIAEPVAVIPSGHLK